LGADVLVNYKAIPWSKAIWELTGKRGVDVVVDHVGEATFKDSVRSLRKGGRVVVPGATTGALLELDARYLFWRQLSVLGSTMANQREFEEVMKLVFMGRLKPVVDRVFPLEQARQAPVRLRLTERITLDRSAGRYSQRTYSAKSGFRTNSLTIPCASNIGYVLPNMYGRTTGSMRDFDPP